MLPPTVQAMVAARSGRAAGGRTDLARRLSVDLYSFDLTEAGSCARVRRGRLDDLVDAEIVVATR